MGKTVTIALANGGTATITGSDPTVSQPAAISYQLFDSQGQALGPSRLLAAGHGFDGQFFSATLDASNFEVAALTTGGFQLVTNEAVGDPQGFTHTVLLGVGVDAAGAVVAGVGSNGLIPGDFSTNITNSLRERIPPGGPVPPQIAALDGGRFAVVYETFDAAGSPTTHLRIGALGGLQTDTILAARPDAITHANGDITLTFNGPGGTTQEILAPDGSVLTARTAIAQVSANVAGGVALTHFAPTDQITLIDNDGTIASGAHSTLTYVVGSHTLIWDQDSEGPAPATQAAVLPTDVDAFTVANLAPGFRPEVLKVIHPTGEQEVTWFDSDHSQAWDTLFARFNAAGGLTTYGSVNDDGTRTVFTFDADNTQPYSRYVDQEDAVGRVLQRTTVVDNGESWTAKYAYVNGQVVSYEVDSFDVNGHLVAQGFFNADGSIMAH